MKRVVLTIFFFAISLAVAVLTVVADSHVFSPVNFTTSFDIRVIEKGNEAKLTLDKGNYTASSGNTGVFALKIGDSSLIRLAPKTVVQLKVEDTLPLPKLGLKIKEGRVWINTKNSLLTLEAQTAEVKLTADPGVYDLQYGNGSVIATSISHSLNVNLVNNFLVIPEKRQMTINESKLKTSGSTIAQLKYSKLSKEFSFVNADLAGVWFTQNQKADADFASNLKKNIEQTVRSRGPVKVAGADSLLNSAGYAIASGVDLLTFDDARRQERKRNTVLDNFHAALYAYLIGNDDNGAAFLQEAQLEMISLDSQDATNKKMLRDMLALTNFAQPSDAFFKARETVRTQYNPFTFEKVTSAFNDLLDLDNSGKDSETDQKIVVKLRQFGSLTAQMDLVSTANQPLDLFFMSIQLNDFLDRHPQLYKQENLQLVEQFERAYLSTITNRSDADEFRQFFIAEKLKRIAIISAQMEKGDGSFQDARKSILLLANQIEALSPTSSDAAVISYFQSQLKELSPLIAFLRSTTAENLHGSFKENYEDFNDRVEEMKKVTELLSSAGGGAQISPFRREELASILANDLGELGLTNIKLELPEVEDSPRVKITAANFESNTFAAIYDTSKKTFTDVFMNGEAVPYTIRLENMKQFLLLKLGRVTLQEGQSVESLVEHSPEIEQSVLEKVAREATISELARIQITVNTEDLGMEDFSATGVIHIRAAKIGEGNDEKIFSFDFVQKTLRVRKLSVQTILGQIPVNDEFALKDVPNRVEQIYQRAIFEKEKEEEIKALGTTDQTP